MITLVNVFPKHLNINGDAANVKVMQKRLEWLGVAASTIEVTDAESLARAIERVTAEPATTFICSGHGSLAAMRDLETHRESLFGLFKLAKESGVCGIVVGSSIEWLEGTKAPTSERVSEFVTVDFKQDGWPTKAFGYVNSESSRSPIALEGHLITTLFNGPFLAKNPEWADKICDLLGATRVSNETTVRVDGYANEIWKLEASSSE